MSQKKIDNKVVISFYDKYSSRQQRVGVNKRHDSIFKLLKEKGLKPNDSVLELGCGIGTFTSLIIPYLNQGEILALDISDKSIDIAKQTYPSPNTEFIATDATTFDFKGKTFDVIVLPDVLEHIPIELHNDLFKKLESVLNQNGFIFIHIPNPYFLEWCVTHRPQDLQVIDQPIKTDILVENTYKNNLFIEELKSYSIWVKDKDYQYIVLRKNNYQDFSKTIDYEPTFLDKVKHKLNVWRK
ncbi:MAG: methyltransferase [Fluviicola sp.]|nr:MAG: methyltransferase [Fluviicola sp.]